MLVLKGEYNFISETLDDYREKFKVWLRAYPVAKKQPIIDEHGQNWSVIYKIFNGIFKDEVWNEYRDEMNRLRTELKANN